MPKITIDGVEYHSEDLSENGRAQLASLQFLEGQMQRLKQEIAVYQTAQRIYAQALKAEIEQAGVKPLDSPPADQTRA